MQRFLLRRKPVPARFRDCYWRFDSSRKDNPERDSVIVNQFTLYGGCFGMMNWAEVGSQPLEWLL